MELFAAIAHLLPSGCCRGFAQLLVIDPLYAFTSFTFSHYMRCNLFACSYVPSHQVYDVESRSFMLPSMPLLMPVRLLLWSEFKNMIISETFIPVKIRGCYD